MAGHHRNYDLWWHAILSISAKCGAVVHPCWRAGRRGGDGGACLAPAGAGACARFLRALDRGANRHLHPAEARRVRDEQRGPAAIGRRGGALRIASSARRRADYDATSPGSSRSRDGSPRAPDKTSLVVTLRTSGGALQGVSCARCGYSICRARSRPVPAPCEYLLRRRRGRSLGSPGARAMLPLAEFARRCSRCCTAVALG